MTPDNPFDTGLQPERTLLAWRRTCLALAAVSAVTVRFAVPELGAAALLAGVIGLALCATAWMAAAFRYRRVHTALHDAGQLVAGAVPIAATALAVALLCAVGIALCLIVWSPW